ncbi:MAG: M48 family metallopeptidase [Burkholderiaceae bacterium]|jgi:Zn-dependent protease with chaperone function|nr:M48 family metallopeptidase [Burkholderiaceae bacterium]
MAIATDDKRVILTGLNTKEYEHSMDKVTLDALRKIPILPKLVELVQTPTSMVTRYAMLGSDLRITEKQFPSLYKIFRKACDVMEVPEPLFYISTNPELNAYTACPDKPIIKIYSYLLDILEEDEIMFVLGHELSHIKSRHLVYSILGDLLSTGALRIIVSTIPGMSVLYTPAEISLNYALYQWMRAAEYSSDRGGFLACQNFEASCRALMKLSGYSRKYADEINLEEFFVQAQAFQEENEAALGKVQQILLSFGQTHPWGVLRVRELMKFRDNGDYDKILRREATLLPDASPPAPKEAAANPLASVSSALSGVKFSNPFKKS